MGFSSSLDRRLVPFREDLADETLRGLVESPRFVTPVLYRVVTSSLPLRRSPSPEAPLDTEALMGEDVALYEKRDGFAWVQLRTDNYVGYLPLNGLEEISWIPDHHLIVPRSFVYPKADFKTPPLTTLSLGARFCVEQQEGRYAKLVGGGFVIAHHIAPVSKYGHDFVEIAERFLHVPYLWGGKTSLGIDCSGLVQVSLAACGISVPRDSDMQEKALQGRPLEDPLRNNISLLLKNLHRGDLLFWKGHVGIMQDSQTLLHANAHAMCVAREPLQQARERILAAGGGEITGVRRV
jgi:cell wall-associated NlpC family hydrolase